MTQGQPTVTTTSDAARARLAEPFVLPNGTRLPNRLVKAALSEGLGRKDFSPGSRIRRLYAAWADSGMGVMISGNVMVDSTAIGEPGNIVVEDERHIDDLQAWAQAAKAGGAQLWAQVNHPGRQCPRNLVAHPVAPSAVAVPGTAGLFATPRELTDPEIHDIVRRFATTSRILVDAGFDGIQVHGAHGYLVSEFLSPLSNRRTDAWGGDAERRRRFLLEVVHAVRAEVGPEVPLSVKLNSADFQRGGFDQDESLEVVRALAAAGIDLLEISGGTYSSAAMVGVDPTLKDSTRRREAYFLDYAERVRREVPDLPLMLTGGFRTLEGMADAVTSGAVDVVGLGRPLAVETRLPADLLSGAATRSHLRPKRSGIRVVDSLTELVFYSVQLWRIADGKAPAPRRHPALNVLHYLLHNGVQSITMPRRARP